MSVQTICPHCETSHTLADDKSGKRIKCKKCQEPFTVGANGAANGKVNGKVNGKLNGAVNGKAHSEVVEIACPECEATMKVRAESLGKKVKCKKCEGIFVARAAEHDEDDDDNEEEKSSTRVTAKAPSPKPAGAKKKQDEGEDEGEDEGDEDEKDKKPKKDKKDAKDEDEDEDEDGKGKKKKKKKKKEKGGPPILLIAGGAGAALVLIAVVIVVVVMMMGGDPPQPPPPQPKDGPIVKGKDKDIKDKDKGGKDKDGRPNKDKGGKDPQEGVVPEPEKTVYEIKNDKLPKKRLELNLNVGQQVAVIRTAAEWFKNEKNLDTQGQCIVIHSVDASDATRELAKKKPWLLVKGDWFNKELKKKDKGIYIEHHLRLDATKDMEKVIDHPNYENFEECWSAWTKWATVADLQQLRVHIMRAPKSDYRQMIMHTLARIKTEDSAKVLALCLSAIDPDDGDHSWSGQEHDLAVTLLREVGGEVAVPGAFNYVYHHHLKVRTAAYNLLYGYAIHWDNDDPFLKAKPTEVKPQPGDKPWVELHFYMDVDGQNKAVLMRKDAVTTLSKKGDRLEGKFTFSAERDKDGVGLKNEKITVNFDNGEVLLGKFGKNAELDCVYEIPPNEKNKDKQTLKFKLNRQGVPSVKPMNPQNPKELAETITYLPPDPWPLDKLPLDKTNWLLAKKGYPTVIDVPRLPVPKGETSYANAAAIIKSGPDRLERLAAMDFLIKNNIDVKVWQEVSEALDPWIDPGFQAPNGTKPFFRDQFNRTTSLIVLERWSNTKNLKTLMTGLTEAGGPDLTDQRKEYGQGTLLPADHDQMIQDFVKVPDKAAMGKILADALKDEKLYPDYVKKFAKYLVANPSIEAQRANLKNFNHKDDETRRISREGVLTFQKNQGKTQLTDDDIAEQCMKDVGSDKKVTLSALQWMAAAPVHSDQKTREKFAKDLKTTLEDPSPENAAIRAAADPVYTRYNNGIKFVPPKKV